MDEPANVLVAYATAHGSTRGVAERLAAILAQREFRVEVRSLERTVDVGAYDAVVFGSPVYNGKWLPPARQFVQRNPGALVARPVWLFSVAAFSDSRPVLGALMKKEPKDIEDLRQTIKPRDYRVFAGAIEREQWSGIG